MDINQYLQNFKSQFEPRLLNFLDQRAKQAMLVDPSFKEAILEIKRTALAGGKRLRPAFVYLGFKALNKHRVLNKKHPVLRDERTLWPACLAIELIQVFALIHDDIMDNASIRRGQITTVKKLGLNKAILVGDLALCLADYLIPEKSKKYFDLLKFEMCGGQWLDINKNQKSKIKNQNDIVKCKMTKNKYNEDEVRKIMELKSASYSVIRPLQIGAVLGGPSTGSGQEHKKLMKSLYNFGLNLGIAFQIRDDILGVFGTEKEVGKPVGSDISEGKKTLLIAKLLKSSKLKVKSEKLQFKIKSFNQFFGKNKILTKEQLELTREILRKSGALKECEREMEKLISKAKKEIENVKIEPEAKKLLLGMGEYLISREK